jgi:hypothetical protein
MRRFDTPAAPPGWAGQGAELIRIVDPTGRAIAWLAPGLGANCVGYAVRRDDDTWRHLLHSGTPRDLRQRPLDYGCAILGPEPDGPGSAHRVPWQFIERDPTAATCAVRCGSVRLELHAQLDDGSLHLELLATNKVTAPTPIAPGLRICLAGEFHPTLPTPTNNQSAIFAGDNVALRLSLPTSTEATNPWKMAQQWSEGKVATEVRRHADALYHASSARITVLLSLQSEYDA